MRDQTFSKHSLEKAYSASIYRDKYCRKNSMKNYDWPKKAKGKNAVYIGSKVGSVSPVRQCFIHPDNDLLPLVMVGVLPSINQPQSIMVRSPPIFRPVAVVTSSQLSETAGLVVRSHNKRVKKSNPNSDQLGVNLNTAATMVIAGRTLVVKHDQDTQTRIIKKTYSQLRLAIATVITT